MNLEFSSSASLSYITYDDDTLPYYLPTKESTMAISITALRYTSEKYMRLRFMQYGYDSDFSPVEAVYCRDLFADEIAAEAEYAKTGQYDPNNMWYTKTFEEDTFNNWICPDTRNLKLQANDAYVTAIVQPCEVSADLDEQYGTTPYYSNEECIENKEV